MAERARGPRKVVVGTALHNMFHPYPGLEKRLGELSGLVDRMAAEVERSYPGEGLDIAAFPEMAVSGGKEGAAAEVSYPLEGPVLERMGEAARRHHCYVVVPLYLVDDAERGEYSNAAALLDRRGAVAGVYRKVFAVVSPGSAEAEGGIRPGRDFPAFDCDFGRVGVQICFDMAFDEGWEALARKGVELVIWPTQWPGRVHPSSRALRHGYFVLSSTWRNNASLTDPTGHVIREIPDRDGVFVERIDLDYRILPWQPGLGNGAAFVERYGARAGFRYSEAEDCGIFWSNDPLLPIGDMVRELGLETKAEEIARTRGALERLRGGPPDLR